MMIVTSCLKLWSHLGKASQKAAEMTNIANATAGARGARKQVRSRFY